MTMPKDWPKKPGSPELTGKKTNSKTRNYLITGAGAGIIGGITAVILIAGFVQSNIDKASISPNIIYPPESFSVQIHILIMIAATIVTVVGLAVGAGITIRNAKFGGDVIFKDIIPISGIILALVSPVIAGVFNPALNYNLSKDVQNNTLEVEITNYGLVSAKKVEVYFSTPGINFSTFGSVPIINGSTYSNSEKLKSEGHALYSIPILTPGSETRITATMAGDLTNSTDAIAYVRSETSTGVHNLTDFAKAYVVYAIALGFSVLYVLFARWNPGLVGGIILAVVNIAAIILIYNFLFYGACEGKGNCLSYGIYD
jgi:hypothetical protein